MKIKPFILFQRTLILLLTCALTACVTLPSVFAEAGTDQTAQYLLKTVTEPTVSAIGGEWTVIGVAGSGITVPDGYFDGYYTRLEQALTDNSGVLSKQKYTEYARVVLALCAIGKDPSNVAGYNLLEPLCDYDAVIRQGVNGAAFALIALDQAKYQIPEEVEHRYTRYLIDHQQADGGFGLSTDAPDPDITAMVLQALAPRMRTAYEKAAVCAALRYLSSVQSNNGGFFAWDAEASESSSQVILGLNAVGIPITDSRFSKDGNTVLDHLLSYRTETGGFAHLPGGEENLMATEQALLALNSLEQTESTTALTLLDKMIYEFEF